MSQLPEDANHRETFEQDTPPLHFGARRLYYQYSVAIPQIHLVLVSILQGAAFGVLLLQPIPLPPTAQEITFNFFQQRYFYAPYLITSLVILIAWMDFAYASAVLIWPPSALQAGLIYLLALAEVAMARSVESFALWLSTLGFATIVGGFMRCNNARIFSVEDFEDSKLGKHILHNELIYGWAYILLGCLGVGYGILYTTLLAWTNAIFPQLENANILLHWISYGSILVEVGCILKVDVIYRQWLLRSLTKNTDLEVTSYGGIRHKKKRDVPPLVQQDTLGTSTLPRATNKSTATYNGRLEPHHSPSQQENRQGKALDSGAMQSSTEGSGISDAADELSSSDTKLDRKRLYHLWEKGYWSVDSLDFIQDSADWREKLNNDQRLAFYFYMAMFLNGESAVTVDLAPFITAASHHEDRTFLATQIADEAKHHVFFDRFLREVVGAGDNTENLHRKMRIYLNSSYNQLFTELDRITNKLRRQPRNASLLAQALVLYHVIIEGLAQAGQNFLYTFGTNTGLLPGFTQGIKFIASDESRHIAFGVLWLRELMTTYPKCKADAICMLNCALPWAVGVFFPPKLDLIYLDSLNVSTRDACTFIIRSLETRLHRVGISPSEVLVLVKLGHTEPPERKTDRLFTLMMSGAFSHNGTPHITKEVMEVIFTSICNVAQWAQLKHQGLNATVQWIFNDAPPRFLEIGVEGETRTEVGFIATPCLTLRVATTDWVRIVAGRLNPLYAMITGRLRISGDWKLALRLHHILSK